MLQTLAKKYPDKFAANITFDNKLAHMIEAGCDMYLMPSRYEPCGLNQIYSLKYGTLPIVRATGGLEDTVEQYDEASGSGTGFKFWEPSANALYYTWLGGEHVLRPAGAYQRDGAGGYDAGLLVGEERKGVRGGLRAGEEQGGAGEVGGGGTFPREIPRSVLPPAWLGLRCSRLLFCNNLYPGSPDVVRSYCK
jgi:hypothetical protein